MTSILKHDNDDDGEDAAGGRLGHLLQMRNEDGVLVVVSRWYGGIHLGPKRFAVISNIARDGLVKYHATTTTATSTESTSIKNKSNSDNNHHSSSSTTAKTATKARKTKK